MLNSARSSSRIIDKNITKLKLTLIDNNFIKKFTDFNKVIVSST